MIARTISGTCNPNHHLSGPIEVQEVEPGDVLVVDILHLGPWPDREWGFTGIFEQDNGDGFLTDHFPEARKTIWDFDGVYTHSRHIEDVRFPGLAHPGIVGTAPSHELLEEWNERERELIERDHGTEPETVNYETGEEHPPLALPPEPNEVLLGDMDEDQVEEAAEEAARTIPPRENAGNCDIKDLSRGSRVYIA